MPAYITFYPLGNADTARIDFVDGRKMLVDYANMRDPEDKDDKRCDLPEELKNDLRKTDKKEYDVVCFTHLDDDHVKGMSEFFWLRHAAKYQDDDRIKIDELWVPAAAITEESLEGDAYVLRQEARHRLKKGEGIRVFSRPDRLKKWMEENDMSFEERSHLITDAGNYVPGFSKDGPERVEFFIHCPFGWRVNDREIEDRNQDSVVFQTTFSEAGEETYVLFGSDVDHETLNMIVRTSKKHENKDRLLWDALKLPHHCSYLSLGSEKGKDETEPDPEVKWLYEEQGRGDAFIISPSKPIPSKGSKDDECAQPPHRQAANYYKRILGDIDGAFKVTMETPTFDRPRPFQFRVTSLGMELVVGVPVAITSVTSRPARAG